MERLKLEATPREVLGKKVKTLRHQGITPVNLYGRGVNSQALQIDTKSLQHVLARAGETDLISLSIAGTKSPRIAIVRAVQKDPRSRMLLHVDFYQVQMTEKLKAEVPLTLVGEPPAVKDKGGILLNILNSLQVEALPDDLPHTLEVDLSGLVDIDQAIFAADIPLSDGVSLLTDPEQIVAKVARQRLMAEEEERVAAEAEVEAAPAPEESETS
jgi:large subunit ribosomal protein L25